MNVPALMATYQLRQREYLLRITRAMTSRLDLPSLLKLILSSAADIVACRSGLIVLTREQGDLRSHVVEPPTFQIRAVYNIAPQYWPAFDPLLERGHVLSSETDAEQSFEHNPSNAVFFDLQERMRRVEERLGFTLGQVLGLPLVFDTELLGVIYLFRAEYAFTEMDWQLLQGFANQAAIAVRNARLYHQLETERSRLATIIAHSPHGVMILDPQRRVLVINQALAAMIDIAPEDAVGRPCYEVLALDNAEGDDYCQEELAFSTGGSLRCEGDLVRPGGAHMTLAVTFTPLYDNALRLVNVIVNVHDITRFREEEEMKSTFTSIISHELKTPVAIIKGYAQTLAREDAEWDADTARQGLQIIEEEADRLESLINNLLDASRIQAGGLRLDWADVNLQALAANTAAALQPQTEIHCIELDFPADLPLVWGDEERLRQVLTNLVGNAIKYSPAGGVIRIGGWSDAGDGRPQVVLYVADEGIGIPQDELPNIFDRFYRVDSSLRRGTPGAGLGLFLCRAIVEAHGGRIWARSEPGRGTTFFVSLPSDGGQGSEAV